MQGLLVPCLSSWLAHHGHVASQPKKVPQAVKGEASGRSSIPDGLIVEGTHSLLSLLRPGCVGEGCLGVLLTSPERTMKHLGLSVQTREAELPQPHGGPSG